MPIIKKGWDIQNIKNATIQLQIGSPHPKESLLKITLTNKSCKFDVQDKVRAKTFGSQSVV